MTDLLGHRAGGVRVEVLDREDQYVGELDGVEGGMVEMTIAAPVRSSGDLQVVGKSDFDWFQHRLRPVLELNGIDYPLGVFIPSVPSASFNASTSLRSIEMLDKLALLTRQRVTTWYTLAAGVNVVNAVASLIEMSGERPGALEASPETLRIAQAWEPGTSLLEIINELLDMINYFSLWVDVGGNFRADPYVPPAQRSPAHVFTDKVPSIYSPDFTVEDNVHAVINQVILTSTADGENDALFAVAENRNPDSDYSIEKIGVRSFFEEAVDITSQSALNAQAQRRLTDLSTTSASVELEHGYLPLLLNDAVGFDDSDAEIDSLHVVQRMEIPINELDLMRSVIRRVASV